MKAKEIAILKAVNSQGLDNFQWGIETDNSGVPLNVLFPIAGEMVDAPEQFLWVWLPEPEQEDFLGNIPARDFPDNKFTTEDNQVLMIWNIAEF